ncbi:MAG: NYN domain-containing protein [Candidatus Woesearchaeota archaeon]
MLQTTINQSVAILCDGNNIERSIHEEIPNAMINFDTLIPRLLNGRGLNRLIYFREGRNISSKLAERLHQHYYGSVIPCHKSADIPLSIKATQLASKVDTIIIMSGDSDYVELIRHLKAEGVRVEIAAIEKTTAKILIEEADYFHPITKDDLFVYTTQRQQTTQNHRISNPPTHEKNKRRRMRSYKKE